MGTPVNFNESGDSDDLQALFDSIASPASQPVQPEPDAGGDSDDLQALFDSISAEIDSDGKPGEGGEDSAVFNRLGHMARQLHDSLRGLGYDKMIEDTARQFPDARQRLSYIAQMTEQAASRVLNATDVAKPIQDELLANAQTLGQRWDRMFANQLSVDEFKSLAADTRGFFQQTPGRIRTVNEQLMEIMMAQDYQDLTGQVIKKVVDMVQEIEAQLLAVLIESMPESKKAEAPEGLLNGPVINAAGRSDVVTTQTQVDDLLESLGF